MRKSRLRRIEDESCPRARQITCYAKAIGLGSTYLSKYLSVLSGDGKGWMDTRILPRKPWVREIRYYQTGTRSPLDLHSERNKLPFLLETFSTFGAFLTTKSPTKENKP